tara:strand:- start:512 stop:1729 length:1218 start_codon:yes stop_codon:yes gene_type:complete
MLVRIAWRNIWRNKRRSMITITAIFIAVFLSVILRSLQLGMYDNMIKNVVGSFSGYLQVHSSGYWDDKTLDNAYVLDQKDLNSIRKIEGVSTTVKRIQSGSLSSFKDLSKFVFITGIESEKEQLLTDWNKRLIEGTLLEKGSESVIIAKGISTYFDLKIGDTLIFLGQGYHGMQAVGAYPVQGIIDMKNPNLNNYSVFMSLPTAQKFMSAENLITNLVIDKKEYSDENIIADLVKSKLNLKINDVMTWQEMIPELEQIIKADSAGGILIIIILYMILSFGIFGTVLMMTQERKYEFGVLLSIGMKRSKLMITIIYETIFLTFIGILSGILLTRPVVNYFHYNPIRLFGDAAVAIRNSGFEPIIPFMNTYDIPFTHSLIVLLISTIICIYPIILIYKINPIKSMKR